MNVKKVVLAAASLVQVLGVVLLVGGLAAISPPVAVAVLGGIVFALGLFLSSRVDE